MPHKCHGNGNNCPTRSQPIWQLPINELDRRDDPGFDERLSGCSLVSSCSNIYEKEQFRQLLEHNFNRYKLACVGLTFSKCPGDFWPDNFPDEMKMDGILNVRILGTNLPQFLP